MSDLAEDRRILLKALKRNFSLEGLFTFVSVMLGLDYEEVKRDGKENTCRELILLMERRGRLRELVRELAARDADSALTTLLARLPDEAGTLDEGEAMRAAPLTRLDAMSTDEVPPPSPALPPGSRGLLPRNPHFTGRVDDLLHLARALKGGETVAIGQVAGVTGLGGIGKTQLANEFAHRYGPYFAGGVFWLSFAQGANVPYEVAACGEMMGLWPAGAELKVEEQVALVQRAWQEPTPRLLIFDNCEEEALLATWRPATGGCRVLLTSRRADWSGTLAVQTLPLGVLKREESRALLATFHPDPAAQDALDAIAEALGHLPLGLHLAGSYLKRYQHHERLGDPTYYLEQLARLDPLEHSSMQGKGAEWSPTKHEQHVARTFALSYEKLDLNDPVDNIALALLARAACLAPGEPIPRALLAATLAPRAEDDATALQVEDALARLLDLGLAEKIEAGALSLHRLVARFIRYRTPTLPLDAVGRVVLVEAQRLSQVGYPSAFSPLIVHLRHLISEEDLTSEQTVLFCNTLGSLLHSQGDYAAARSYLEQALMLAELVYGASHSNTATSLNNLGILLSRQGAYEEAQEHLERALAIREQVLGMSDPSTASSLNDLGGLLKIQGKHQAARTCLERALAIREQVLGTNNPDTATSLTSLASLLVSQGVYNQARSYLERALVIYEQVLGPTHPNTATSLNNLGALLVGLGAYATALGYYERALAIYEQVLGPTHPTIAISLSNLGALLYRQGKYKEAYPYYQRAERIADQKLGSTHPDTKLVRANLAALNAKLRDDTPVTPP